jgi:hypothetical protein
MQVTKGVAAALLFIQPASLAGMILFLAIETR